MYTADSCVVCVMIQSDHFGFLPSSTPCICQRIYMQSCVRSTCGIVVDSLFSLYNYELHTPRSSSLLQFAICDVSSKSVALGGTHEKGDWTTTIDHVHRQRIWQGCCRLVPSLEVNFSRCTSLVSICKAYRKTPWIYNGTVVIVIYTQ